MSNVTEFVNNGWVLFSSFDGTRYYSYYGDGQIMSDLGVAITNFVRSNKSFKVKLPKGSHTFQLTIHRSGQFGQLSTIRFGVGVETSSARLPETNYIRLDVNGEYVVGTPVNSGATIRLGKLDEDSASAKQINTEKYLYITFADDLHSAMVSNSQLNVSMLVGGNEAVTEFIEYFDNLAYTRPSDTSGGGDATQNESTTDTTVDRDPETGEILDKHALLGSGVLSKKHITNSETHLLYTIPQNKSGTINVDMTNLGTNLIGVSIYVGRGSTPTKADLVRSNVPIPREEYDHNAKKMKINYACVESILCESGDKIWVKVDRMTSIPSVSSSSSASATTKQKSVAQMDAGPTWAEIADDPNLLYPGNTVLSDTVTPTKLPPSPFVGYVSTS